jgi:glycosyltransferase involved in cell wall biosynthesis
MRRCTGSWRLLASGPACERKEVPSRVQSGLVSCIVAVFNGERFLKEALDSILAQTYQPLEAIVVDDGSTDGTLAVAAEYGERIRTLWQPNAGPPMARNLGLKAARGEFLAFLDADDLWHPEKLARQMARFQARPELDLCVTHIRNFWMPEVGEEEARFVDHRLSQPVPGYVTQTLLARRSAFELLGPFNTSSRHTAELDWFARAVEEGLAMELLPEVLVYRRLHGGNLSREAAADSRSEHVDLVKAILDRRRRRDGSNRPSQDPEPLAGQKGG